MTTTTTATANISNTVPNYSVNDLLVKVNSYTDQGEQELAREFCIRALEMEPCNVDVLVKAGEVEIELGQNNDARELFKRAVAIDPDHGYSMYMYLGQLSTKLEAVKYYEKGIQIMIKERKGLPDDSKEADELSGGICAALCAVTEVYLTDLCDEHDAEKKCEQYLNQAIEFDGSNPEPYQVLASVRISQLQIDKAKDLLGKSLSLWVNLEPGDSRVPEYESRVTLAKLLIETDEYQQAIKVLEGLQRENEEDVDLWYLYGSTYFVMGEEAIERRGDEEEKLGHWKDARECLEKALKLYDMLGWDDEGVFNSSKELLETVNRILPPQTEEDEESDDVNEGNAELPGNNNGDDNENDEDEDMQL